MIFNSNETEIMIPILQIWKLGLKEVKNWDSKLQNQNQDAGSAS